MLPQHQPLLALKPVSFSLAADFSPFSLDTPPLTPSGDFTCRKPSPVSYGGPLSSHPVTPNESEDAITYFAPMARSNSRLSAFPDFPTAASRASSAHTNRPIAAADFRLTERFDAYPRGKENNMIQTRDTHKQDTVDNSNNSNSNRRPSIAERFLRFRSLSSLRSSSSGNRNSSSTSLAQSSHNNLRREYAASTLVTVVPSEPHVLETPRYHTVIERPRGTKRGATSPPISPSGARSTLRRRSMDLLTTARRASGFWSRETLPLQKELGTPPKPHASHIDAPVPQVQLEAVDLRLGGDELFREIGR